MPMTEVGIERLGLAPIVLALLVLHSTVRAFFQIIMGLEDIFFFGRLYYQW